MALFILLYSPMLLDAFSDCNSIQYRMDDGIFNLHRLNSTSKVMELLARDLLYADDCALAVHCLEDAQAITHCFAQAAARFGLAVSVEKTEVIKHARPGGLASSNSITINGAPLNVMDSFCYLGIMLSSRATLDTDRLSRASSAFGRLQQRLWQTVASDCQPKSAYTLLLS